MPQGQAPHPMPPPPPEGELTWSMLLAHWTAFAQASLALPKTADGDRWRSAVTSIINLQAVTFALGDLDRLADAPTPDETAGAADARSERALALDKAEIIVRSATGQLHALWRGDVLPDEVVALIGDAAAALKAARGAGVEWRVTAEELVLEHPGDLIDRLLQLGFDGDLYIATPGVQMFRGAPAAFAGGPDGSRPDEHVLRAVKEFLVEVSRPERVPGFRQVYRQFDFGAGRPVRDLIVPFEGGLPAGQPLLVPAILGGEARSVTLPPRKGAKLAPIPVLTEPPPTD